MLELVGKTIPALWETQGYKFASGFSRFAVCVQLETEHSSLQNLALCDICLIVTRTALFVNI